MDNPFGILPPGLEQLSIESRGEAKKSKELGQETFLELMVAQLENQDPLKPMESGDFLGQLAQFATVNGISELQSTMTNLAASLQSNQALQASTLVGRQVLIPANGAPLTSGGSVSGAIELTENVSQLNVVIEDASGQLVRRLSLGGQQAGLIPFTWDGINEAGGRAAPTVYRVRAEGVVDGESQAFENFVRAQVESVTLTKDGSSPQLNLMGMGSMSLEQVRQVM